MQIRFMNTKDYEQIYELWKMIDGFLIRSIDDSKEGVERFLKRNPDISVVAEIDGTIIGVIMAGHDGRKAGFYHVCVHKDYRNQGIGKKMIDKVMEALKREKITTATLAAFGDNEGANRFWSELGWVPRKDLNYYSFYLEPENKTFRIENKADR